MSKLHIIFKDGKAKGILLPKHPVELEKEYVKAIENALDIPPVNFVGLKEYNP